jgi:tetratricopeptide (TPR) repeat protein
VLWPDGRRAEILAGMATISVTQAETAPTAAPCSAMLAQALGELAELQFRLGDWTGAYASTLEALRRARAERADRGVATGLARLALIDAGRGWTLSCRQHVRQALYIRQTDRAVEALTREALGILALGRGEADAAIESFRWLADFGAHHPRWSVSAPAWALDLTDAYRLRGGGGDCPAGEEQDEQPLGASAHAPLAFERARADLYRAERGAQTRELKAALRTFQTIGADPWATRARRALGAVA